MGGIEINHTAGDDPVVRACRFLKKFTSPKMVVIIDTHCLENGYFVWSGDSSENYQTCSMKEVCVKPSVL